MHEGTCTVTKGEPAYPHTEAELAGKFVDLGDPLWGSATTRALLDGLSRLETIGDFRHFMKGLPL